MDYKKGSKEFLNYLRYVRNVSEHTVRNYLIDLNIFMEFVSVELGIDVDRIVMHERGKRSFEIRKIDKWVVRRYLEELQKSVKRTTVLRRLSSLRSFFKFLAKRRYINRNPLDEVSSPKRGKSIPKAVTFEEVLRFFEAADCESYVGLRDRAMMELFYSSALRLSELVALNVGDIDFDNMMVRIMGKGRKERVIPVTGKALEFVRRYLEDPRRERVFSRKFKRDKRAIFLNKYGGRISERSVDRKFSEYLKKSGLLRRITPHVIRHSIATHWLEKGMDLKSIQILLGHSLLSTTTIYTKVTTKHKKKIYERAHPRAKL